MTIARTKLAGWGVGDELTSSELNAVDINVTNALDKRSGQTDTLSSGITVDSSGSVTFDNSDCSLDNHSTMDVANGSRISLTSSSIVATTGGIIEATNATARIRTRTGGRFELGDDDWVQFSTPRTKRRSATPQALIAQLGTGWTIFNGLYMAGPGTSAVQYLYIDNLLHHGATLTSVTVYVYVQTHVSLPATLPSLRVRRINHALADQELLSTTYASATPPDVTAWDLTTTSFTYTCNQNNVIDRDLYAYVVDLTDEHGANSGANNAYFMVTAEHAALAEMSLP